MPEFHAADPLLGQTIGQAYELVEVLGKGGMAIVYRGRHVLTDQDVAVKVLPPELAEQTDVRERFIAEARTLARLEHPNIIGLYNFLQEQGHLYIVMQFAEGATFDQIIAREGRLSLADVVAIGIGTLEALCYAHERDVIHRDIKPSNIVIRGDGAIKVMDFGIAKIVGSTKLTQTGQTMGTVRYMSPEQVRGKHVDQRTDIYSLGVTLYEACTGRTPFDGETHFDIMHKHLSEFPRPPSELTDIPQQLSDALMRALQKRPEERFQNAAEFRQALRGVPVDLRTGRITAPAATAVEQVRAGQRAQPATVNPRSTRRRRRLPGLLAALMLLTAALAVAWTFLGEPVRHAADPAGHVRPAGRQVGPHSVASTATPAVQWLQPRGLARRFDWAIDRRFEEDRLRVLATAKVDVSAVAAAYRRTAERYRKFLRREGLDPTVAIYPLTLAIVPHPVFAAQDGWVSPRYEAPASTLYLDGARPAFDVTDLPYGVALHFCARMAELSSERCVELAESFEHMIQQAHRGKSPKNP